MISKKNIMISRPCVNPRQNIIMNVSGGSAKVTATFNKDSFNVGETAIIECFVDNTQSSKSIRSLKIKFRRLLKGTVSKRSHNDLDETIIEREFHGMPQGKSGVIKMDFPINLIKDTERFIKSLSSELRSRKMADLDVLKMLPTPTVESTLIQCFYFLEVHVYFDAFLFSDKLNVISLPILVCRPILGLPVANS